MIKKIHYCWVGSEPPDSVIARVEEWKKLCPDFEIMPWNDTNINIRTYEHIPFWTLAYSRKKWAYVSDIIQFSKIYEHGGFYLDCDVVMIKPLNEINFNSEHLLLGYMYDGVLSGGFMYAPPKHPLVEKILHYYNEVKEGRLVCNNTIMTDCINANVPDLLLNGRFYTSDKHKLTIFPKEYFCQPSFIASKSFVLDQFAGSWKETTNNKSFDVEYNKFSLYRIFKRKINCFLSIMRNEFRPVYLNAILGRKFLKEETWRKRRTQQ